MLHMLRRSIDYFVMPLGMSIELGIAALLLYLVCRKQSRPWGRRIAFALGCGAILILYLSSIRVTAESLTAWVEREYPPRPVGEIEAVDAVMVLGGGTLVAKRRDGTVTLDPGPRFEAVMELMAAGRARVLVLSGTGSQAPGDPRTEGEHLRDEAMRRGLDASRIVITPMVRTTGDEARVLAELVRQHGWTNVAVATDAAHMGRALSLVREQGIHAIPFSTSFEPPLPAQPPALKWLPTAASLHRTTRAWHELLGRLAN